MRTGWFGCFLLVSSLTLTGTALAHSGGALDNYGCHADHRKGDYHCHLGELRGYSFPSRAAMLEAVRTGNLPEQPPAKEGFFAKFWPFGHKKDKDEKAAKNEAAPAATPEAPATPGASAAAGSAPAGAEAPAGESTAPAPAAPAAPSAATAPAAQAAGASAPPAAVAPAPGSGQGRSFEERLKILAGLYDMGLITKDEYEARRKAILDQL